MKHQKSELFKQLDVYNQKQEIKALKMTQKIRKQASLGGEPDHAEGMHNSSFKNKIIGRFTISDAQNFGKFNTFSTAGPGSPQHEVDHFKLRKATLQPEMSIGYLNQLKNNASLPPPLVTPGRSGSRMINEFNTPKVETGHAIRWVGRKTLSRLRQQDMEIERIEKKIADTQLKERLIQIESALKLAQRGKLIPPESEDDIVGSTFASPMGMSTRQSPLAGLMSPNFDHIPFMSPSQSKLEYNNQQGSPMMRSPMHESAQIVIERAQESRITSNYDDEQQFLENAYQDEQNINYQTEMKMMEHDKKMSLPISPQGITMPPSAENKWEDVNQTLQTSIQNSVLSRNQDENLQTTQMTQQSHLNLKETLTKKFQTSQQSQNTTSRRTMSLLQKPDYEHERDFPQVLDQYVTNFKGYLQESLKEMPKVKFKRAFEREFAKDKFSLGQKKAQVWTKIIEQKERDCVYHHLKPKNQRETQEVFDIRRVTLKDEDLKQTAILDKIQSGAKLTYEELTRENVQRQLPQINPKYLMDKTTCANEEEYRIKRPDMNATMSKFDRVKKEEIADIEQAFRTTGSWVDQNKDEEDSQMIQENIDEYEEWYDKTYDETKSEEEQERKEVLNDKNRVKTPETLTEIQRLIEIAVFSDEFRDIITNAHQTLHTFKSFKLIKAQRAHEKKQQSVIMKKVYIRFIQRLLLQRKLFDKEFLRKRYAKLAPSEKTVRRIKDRERYGSPPIPERDYEYDYETVKHFLKLKLAPEIGEKLHTLSTNIMDFSDNGLDILKTAQYDQLTKEIVKDLKENQHSIKDVKSQIWQKLGGAFGGPHPLLRMKQKNEKKELVKNTQEINQKLTGKRPEPMIINRNAQNDVNFLKKLKEMMITNSMMDIHKVDLEEDQDVAFEKEFQKNDGYTDDEQGFRSEPSSPISPGKKRRLQALGDNQKRDLEMLFAKIAEEHKFQPILRSFRALMNTQKNNTILDIHDFKIEKGWSKIIHEVLLEQKNLQFMVRKLILNNNLLSGENFDHILDALFKQEGILSIIYQKNQLCLNCVEKFSDFLAEKNLEHLNLKQLVDTPKEVIMALPETLLFGSNLSKLELIQIPHLNDPEPFQKILDALPKLSTVQHLNLSSNFFDSTQIAKIMAVIAEFLPVITLNLSDNNMRPTIPKEGKKDKNSAKFYKAIVEMLKVGNIQCLNLQNMQLGDRVLTEIGKPLLENTTLVALHLCNNQLGKEAISRFRWLLGIQLEKDEMPGQLEAIPEENNDEEFRETKRSSIKGSNRGSTMKVTKERLSNPFEPERRVLSLERNYKDGEFDEYKAQGCAQVKGKPFSSIKEDLFKGLSVNLMNKEEKVQLKRLERNTYDVAENASPKDALIQGLELFGGKFILQRVLGHLEFECVFPPLFDKEKIERVKEGLAIAERQKREMEKYDGQIVVNGKLVTPTKRPDSVDSEERDPLEKYSEEPTIFHEQMLKIERARYTRKPQHMPWKLTDDCWHCQKAKYCVLFYQRSKANLWFQDVSKDPKFWQMVPQNLLDKFKQDVEVLNQSLKLPGAITEKYPIIDPVVIGDFEVTKFKYFRNPHEYVDRLVRDDVLMAVNRSLVKVKEKLDEMQLTKWQRKPGKAKREYQKHFMVRYDEEYTKVVEKGWFTAIQKNLKYQYNTTYLNCVPMEENQTDNLNASIMESDLFVSTFFLKSGRRNVLVLDCERQGSKYILKLYKKEFLVDMIKEDLAKPSESETKFMYEQFTQLGIQVNMEKVIQQEESDRRTAEKKRIEMEKKLKEQQEALAKIATKKKKKKKKDKTKPIDQNSLIALELHSLTQVRMPTPNGVKEKMYQ